MEDPGSNPDLVINYVSHSITFDAVLTPGVDRGKSQGMTFDGEDLIKGKNVIIGLVQILAEVSSIARAPAWVKIVGSGGDFPIVTQYWHSDTYVKYDAS